MASFDSLPSHQKALLMPRGTGAGRHSETSTCKDYAKTGRMISPATSVNALDAFIDWILNAFLFGKFTQAKPVMTSLCDTSLTIEIFKVSDKNHAEINSRRNARPSKILVKRGAQLFDMSIKSALVKNLIEFGIKRVGRCFGNLIGGNEQFLLFRFASAECNGEVS